MAQIIRLTNEYGGKLERCDRHVEGAAQYLVGRKVAQLVEGECEDCRAERQRAELPGKVRALLLSGELAHTRFRPFSTLDGGGYVTLYRREPTSPTGVLAAASISAAEFDRIFDELRAEGLISSSLAPLSPTEGL